MVINKTLYRANERGKADYGWLKANHYFSFGEWYNPAKIRFGLLRVLNDDFVAPSAGFPTHPHDNMEIVTIPLTGALEHKDSMGSSSVIKAGEVQIMSAGTGVTHSEYNPSDKEPVTLFQIWIFPREKDLSPGYDQTLFERSGREEKLQLIVSPDGDDNSLVIQQDSWFWLGEFSSGRKIDYQMKKKGNGLFLLVIEGKAALENELLEKRDAIGISEVERVEIEFLESPSVLIIEVPVRM
jgi:quercetin 2,3-dioxygenase